MMRALREGQGKACNTTRDICREARIVERPCGLGASALLEVVQLVSQRMEPEAA